MVNNSTNINKKNNPLSPKESLNSDGQQFYQYQQNEQLPLMNKKVEHCDAQQFYLNKMNNHLSPKESLNCDGQQFYQYQKKWTITSHLKKV